MTPSSQGLKPATFPERFNMLLHIWEGLDGAEPAEESERWMEANDVKFLFHPSQKWTRTDARDFAQAAWNYLGYGK